MTFQNKLSPYVDIIHPNRFKDFISKNKDIKDLKPSLYNVVIATIIMLIAGMVYASMAKNEIEKGFSQAELQTPQLQYELERLNIQLTPSFMMFSFIFFILIFYVMQYALYKIIQLLGGKGNFNAHSYIASTLHLSITVLRLLIATMLITITGTTIKIETQPGSFNPIELAVSLIITGYVFFIVLNMIKIVYNISTKRALLAIIIFFVAFLFLALTLILSTAPRQI